MQSLLDNPKVKRESTHREFSAIAVTELVIAARQSTGRIAQELTALAGRIHLCNHQSNIWLVEKGYQNTNGEFSPAIGRFWRCNSKLCSSCLARQAQLSRRKLRDAISRQQLKKHERYYFITFTIPNPSLSLTQTRHIVNRSWSLFRKRSLCVSLIRGGCKSEEFTLTANGFHYHLHCIVRSNYLDYNRLREEWTTCVEKVFHEQQLPFETKSADGNLWLVAKPIMPTERSIQEVCKYVTKGDSWRKMPREQLVQLAQVRRWNRMFELFGSFAARDAVEDGEVQPIVHTRPLTDDGFASAPRYWRDKLAYMDAEFYLIMLEGKITTLVEHESIRIWNLFGQQSLLTFEQISEPVAKSFH